MLHGAFVYFARIDGYLLFLFVAFYTSGGSVMLLAVFVYEVRIDGYFTRLELTDTNNVAVLV
jgi:hypothetical protein